jgi:two-component system KDP operon response regulator KdpE
MSPSLTALVIEDDAQVRRAVKNALLGEFAAVLEASSAQEGVDLTASARPDLIVLDLGLPDRDGAGICREIRAWSAIPIIVLSARQAEREKIAMLEAGADDYVIKPFSPAELRARVRVQIRRVRMQTQAVSAKLEVDDLTIDVGARVVRRDGEYLHLTPIEWDLLRVFVKHAGRTLTHQQIFEAVWRQPGGDAQAYLRVHIANLRRKIERDPVRPRLIVTEVGVGYRFNIE